MQLSQISDILDDQPKAQAWLSELGIEDADRGYRNIVRLAKGSITLDLLTVICQQLSENLSQLSDADMALNNLVRFFESSRNQLALGSLFQREPHSLPILLQIFSTSQYLSDVLVSDPESYDLLRMTAGSPVSREQLIEELQTELDRLEDTALICIALRRFKRRETLRIAYGDIVLGQSLQTVTSQISILADTIVHCAVQSARRNLEKKRGVPQTIYQQPAKFVVLALGKLGGNELNYSSDIDLIFFYDHDGNTNGQRAISNNEFFTALSRDVVKLLADSTELGAAYRVDLRLRPEGKPGAIVISAEAASNYYHSSGRTWERQAMLKARPIAGDLELGEKIISDLQSWIYSRYLSRADITGIKALKRRIEAHTSKKGEELVDVKTGQGGIRDIEFAIQFLQLLNGGDLKQVRTGNTIHAIQALEQAGCLNDQERGLLIENYQFLRKIEHRLQIMFDLQTHRMPENDTELRKLAVRTGYVGTPNRSALAAFNSDYERKTKINRQILDHLLHDAFEDEKGDNKEIDPEVDLVLDPTPSKEQIVKVLGKHGFSSIENAYQNLMALSEEKIRFLSTRRCRHFLAAIAPVLLKEIAQTPDPDSTLVNLVKVSDSLGGKGVLWELFSFNTPTMKLYVELCSSSAYLADILVSNPGMIDDLMDSLLLDKLPTYEQLDRSLTELCRNAEDIEPILHSFKNCQHLRVGIRDILGKEDIQATNASLADIGQACIKQIALREYDKLVQKFGEPTNGSGSNQGKPTEFIIVGMGKFGGREPNYHSDFDLIFLYECEGNTVPTKQSRRDPTSNKHFFGELGQKIIKIANKNGPYGRLYEIDPRLRPTGKSGPLASSLDELTRYFRSGEGQLWERLALCKARVVFGSEPVTTLTRDIIWDIVFGPKWKPSDTQEVYDMRMRMQETASERNLKRGPGGIVDIEFIAQTLLLKNQGNPESIRRSGTLTSLSALHEASYLSEDDYKFLCDSYRFMRMFEARLRLMNFSGRHEIPQKERNLIKLARLLGYPDSTSLLNKCKEVTTEVRRRFDVFFGR